ncbi:MAG: phospholipase A [Plesiomonas sp.]|uniref:phospholipase A n=1 Tax=Plesiomonas sp. TaxID=2486279 RepID=UPI003EE582C1
MLGSRWAVGASVLLSGLAISQSVGAQTVPESEAQAASVPAETQSIKPNYAGRIANLLEEHNTPFLLIPYDTNYVLYSYSSNINKGMYANRGYDANDLRKDNIKFQLSFAFPIWRGLLGNNSVLAAAYTQKSLWQATNFAISAPFLETNYEPRVFTAWSTDYTLAGWHFKELELGFVHQSNGRGYDYFDEKNEKHDTSRSWNRIYARVMAQRNNWMVDLEPWVRVDSSKNDDNPDISDYLGHYRMQVGYKAGDSVYSLEGRYNWNSDKGSAQLGWSYPITPSVRFYTQLFTGYGQTMIDYNFRQTSFGMGFMLNDIM